MQIIYKRWYLWELYFHRDIYSVDAHSHHNALSFLPSHAVCGKLQEEERASVKVKTFYLIWHRSVNVWMHTLLCKTEKRPSSVVPLITKIHSGKVSTIFLPRMAFILFPNKHRCRVLPGFFKRIMKYKYFPTTNMMCLFGKYVGILKFLGVS